MSKDDRFNKFTKKNPEFTKLCPRGVFNFGYDACLKDALKIVDEESGKWDKETVVERIKAKLEEAAK